MQPRAVPLLPARVRDILGLQRILPEICNDFDPDLVCANGLLPAIASAWVKRKIRAKLVYAVMVEKRRSRVTNIFYKYVSKKADGILFNSKYTEDSYQSIFTNVRHRLINYSVVLPPEVTLEDTGKLAEIRTEYSAGASVLIGMVGRITPKKGMEYFISTAKHLLEKGEVDARFIILGGEDVRFPKYASEIRKSAKDRLHDKIIFLGHVEQVHVVMAAMDVLLVPTLGEGFGRIAVEAAYLGLPVVGTSPGGIEEVLQYYSRSATVPWRRPDLMADAAKAMVEKFPYDPEERLRDTSDVTERFSCKNLMDRETQFYRDVIRKII